MDSQTHQLIVEGIVREDTGSWLRQFTVNSMYNGKAVPERHLIQNFLTYKSTVALVADGGVGKTYVTLELALRLACGPDLPDNYFLGFKVLEKANVIMFTVEDGKDSIHRRLDAIDPSGELRRMAQDSCCIIPVQEQIMDGLTLAEKDGKGNFGPSKAWKAMQGYIQAYIDEMQLINGKDLPLLVIIDTYSATHHGDENSATGTNEWFRALGLLKQFDATVFMTHHVRKADPRWDIRSPSDMKAAVRGSSAFMNSLRAVYGIWEMPWSESVARTISEEGKSPRLFNMGLLKNNTGISWDDRSDARYPEPMITLRRLSKGQLVYDAAAHAKRIELTTGRKQKDSAQLRAAIIYAVRWYANEGYPLSKSNLTREKEQFLPPRIRDLPIKAEVEPMINSLLREGIIKQIKIKKTNGQILDVPEGPYSLMQQTERRNDTPVLQWDAVEYDEKNATYNDIL